MKHNTFCQDLLLAKLTGSSYPIWVGEFMIQMRILRRLSLLFCLGLVLVFSFQNCSQVGFDSLDLPSQTPAPLGLVCEPNSIRSCDLENGSGNQRCASDGGSWLFCEVDTCNPGYLRQGNACVPVPVVAACDSQVVRWGQTLGCSANIQSALLNQSRNISSTNSTNGTASFRCTNSGWEFVSGACYSKCVDNRSQAIAWHDPRCQTLLIGGYFANHGQSLNWSISTEVGGSEATGYISHTCYDGKLINQQNSCKPTAEMISGSDCPARSFNWKDSELLPTSSGANCYGSAPTSKRGTVVSVGNQNTNVQNNSGYSGSVTMICGNDGQWRQGGSIGCTELKGVPQSCKGPTSFTVGSCKYQFNAELAHQGEATVHNSTSGYKGKILLRCNDGVFWQGPMSNCNLHNAPNCSDLNANLSVRDLGSNTIQSYRFKSSAKYRLSTGDPNSLVQGHYIVASDTQPSCSVLLFCRQNPSNPTQAFWDTQNAEFTGSCAKP